MDTRVNWDTRNASGSKDASNCRHKNNSRDASTVGTPTTVLASAGTPKTAEVPETVWMWTPREISLKFAKNSSEEKKSLEQRQKRVKTSLFVEKITVSPITIETEKSIN